MLAASDRDRLERMWRLWRLQNIPAGRLRALRQVLAAASEAQGARPVQADDLPGSVRWVAEDWLPATPKAAANLIELLDLGIAYHHAAGRSERSALNNEIGEAIFRQERLVRTSRPAKNSRCYCGSGRKHKRCHGSPELQSNWVVDLASAARGDGDVMEPGQSI